MPDPYLDPDTQPGATLDAMIDRLEERGRHAGFAGMIDAYLSVLPTDRPLTMLDLGCGTGIVARRAAGKIHPGSAIHGADVSRGLLNEARRLDRDERIRWDHVEPGPLPYAAATFDVLLMHTLLSHVADPVAVLSEASRVLKSQGQLIVFDADHAGTTYAQPSYAVMRRVDQIVASAIASQPDVCRQMPRYLKAAGFRLRACRAEVIAEAGRGDYWLSSVRGLERMLPALGVLPRDEIDDWVETMRRSHDDGTFFAAGAFYTFLAEPA